MKRKVAQRKLKRKCTYCDCCFKRGDVYYINRRVLYIGGDIKVLAYETTLCPKCKYKTDSHRTRFEVFKKKCHHPLVEEVWSTIPGECIMQPDHDECTICGKWL